MCRHIGYLGPPIILSELVLNRPHSLLRQSYAPTDMRCSAMMNADGFGIGWYVDGRPQRYRQASPMWSDEALPGLCATIHSGAVLGAVRSATVGMPVVAAACAPFTDGRWLFSLNGLITGWPASVAEIARRLPVIDLMTLDAPTDAALLWAVLRRSLAEGVDPADLLLELVNEVSTVAPGSRLNLMLTDGVTLHATTWSHSLTILSTSDSVVIASEPYDDDPRWITVPDRQLVIAVPGNLKHIGVEDWHGRT